MTTKGNTKKKRKKLKLYSKKNKKLTVVSRCTQCRKKASPMKHYYQSNKGPVNLCIQCEPTILDRSFGKVDAMDKSNSFDHYNSKEVKHRI